MLSVQDLDLFYGDAQALDGVSLEVPKGEIVAIVGANGAGKSSLIRTIAGIETPRSGRIRFNNIEISKLESHAICNLGIGQVAEGRQHNAVRRGSLRHRLVAGCWLGIIGFRRALCVEGGR